MKLLAKDSRKRFNTSNKNSAWIFTILITIGIIVFLVPQLDELKDSLDLIKTANLTFLIWALFTSILTYVVSTVVVMGAAFKKLNFAQTFMAQLASTAMNRITPKGVGAAVFIERYLERNRHTRTQATASVSLVYATGVIMHTILTIVVITLVNPDLLSDVFVFTSTHLIVVTVLVASILAGLLFVSVVKSFIKRWLRDTRVALQTIVKKPLKMMQLFGGSAAITLTYALAFSFSIKSFGYDIAFTDVLFVYLAASVLAAATPTPGGLGVAEAALTVGLTVVDVPLEQAIASVLAFRVITFWLPIIPGFIALRYLRKNKSL